MPPSVAGTIVRALSRYRRFSLAVAGFSFLYTLFIAVTGGFDLALGPIEIRSHAVGRFIALTIIASLAALLGDARIVKSLTETGQHAVAALQRNRWGIAAAAAVAIAILASLWIAAARARGGPVEVPFADMALLELYTRHATAGELQTGPYSRFGWHHPGPILFHLFRPVYALFGSEFLGLRWTALIVNLLCVGATLAIAWRYARPALAITLSLGLGLYVVRYPDVLASPWNAHLLITPLACLIVIGTALIAGATRYWPAAAIIASFLVQTHVGTAPTVATLGAVTILWILLQRALDGSAAPHLRWMNVGAWVLLIVWLPPLAEELGPGEGNLTAIWTSFQERPFGGPPLEEATAAFVHILAAPFVPGVELAWGGKVFGEASLVSRALVLTTLAALPWAVVSLDRRGDRFGSRLAGLALCASLAALWSTHRIQGAVYDQVVFWMSIIGVVNMAVVVSAVLEAMPARLRMPLWRTVAAATSVVVFVAAAVLGFQGLTRVRVDSLANHNSRQVATVASTVQEALAHRGALRPLFRLAQPTWGDASGILLALEKGGTDVAVEPRWTFMFGDALLATGEEDAEFVIADEAMRPYLGEEYEQLLQWNAFSLHVKH